MLPAVLGGIAGVVVTSLIALVIDYRGRQERRHTRTQDADAAALSDVWGAINDLRENIADNNEHLAEIRGLLTGIYAEILGDPSLINEHHSPPRIRRRVRKDDVT